MTDITPEPWNEDYPHYYLDTLNGIPYVVGSAGDVPEFPIEGVSGEDHWIESFSYPTERDLINDPEVIRDGP